MLSSVTPLRHEAETIAAPADVPLRGDGVTFSGFPEIDVAAVRLRLDKPLVLWYFARVTDKQGEGVVLLATLRGFAPRSTLKRVLSKGRGVFWTVSGGRLFLRSTTAVAKSLEVPGVTALYDAPTSVLTGSQTRGWFALNAFATLRREKPISVAAMAFASRVDERTLYRWMRDTQWPRVMNIALDSELSEGHHGVRGGALWVMDGEDGRYQTRRLPNTLIRQTLPVRGRGRMGRINLRLTFVKRRGQQFRPSGGLRPFPYTRVGESSAIALWEPSFTPQALVSRFDYITHDRKEKRQRMPDKSLPIEGTEAPIVTQIRRRLAVVKGIHGLDRTFRSGPKFENRRRSPV